MLARSSIAESDTSIQVEQELLLCKGHYRCLAILAGRSGIDFTFPLLGFLFGFVYKNDAGRMMKLDQ